MTDFNVAARSWDSNNIHVQRSEAIAKNLLARIPVQPNGIASYCRYTGSHL